MEYLDTIAYKISLVVGAGVFIYMAREDWESVGKVGVMLLGAGFCAASLELFLVLVLHPVWVSKFLPKTAWGQAPYVLGGLLQMFAVILILRWYSKRKARK